MMQESSAVPTDRRALLAGLGGLAAGTFLSAGRAEAGSLTPPDAPSPTGKPLTEVEPRVAINLTNTPGDADSLFKITQPGSYYLTGNITGVVGKHGIEIAISHVVIDLCGFNLIGVPGSLAGIVNQGTQIDNITIRNGTVRNWGGGGVNLQVGFFNEGRMFLIQSVAAISNGGPGILCGEQAVISDCIANSNQLGGIQALSFSTITRCTSRSNQGAGISNGNNSCTTDCVSGSNSGVGISIGFSASSASNCTATGNSGGGISGLSGCTIENCSASSNGGSGISVGTDSTITNCSVASQNVHGIITGDYSTVTGCSVRGCGNASNVNSGGIRVGDGSIVSRCAVSLNANFGISAANSSTIRENNCHSNTQFSGNSSGILVGGSDNRIENNNAAINNTGIRVTAAGNLIIGNSCSGNTIVNYDIASNNRYGVVINLTAGGTASVSGSAAAGTLNTSNEPWANFAY